MKAIRLSYGAYDLASERLAAPLASGRALLLTATDLAFSGEESRRYLKARGSTQDAAEVQRALEGWPAGIGLAAAGVGERRLSNRPAGGRLLSAAAKRA